MNRSSTLTVGELFRINRLLGSRTVMEASVVACGERKVIHLQRTATFTFVLPVTGQAFASKLLRANSHH